MAWKPKYHRVADLLHHATTKTHRDRRATAGEALYKSARWRRLRGWVLAGAPLCADPFGIHAVPEAATELDHRVPLSRAPDRAFDPQNLQPLCKRCHSRKTYRETLGRSGRGVATPTPPGGGGG